MSKIIAMVILITSGILKLRDTSILSLAVFMVIIGDLIRAFNRFLSSLLLSPGPGRPSRPRMDRRAATSSGNVNISHLASRLRENKDRIQMQGNRSMVSTIANYACWVGF